MFRLFNTPMCSTNRMENVVHPTVDHIDDPVVPLGRPADRVGTPVSCANLPVSATRPI